MFAYRDGNWLRFAKQQPPVVCTHSFARLAVPPSRRALSLVFFVLPFAEPHAGATAVFVDEVHASALERADDRGKGRGIARVAAGFNIGHRVAVDLGGLGEVPHAPIQRGAGHSYLCACHRHWIVLLSHVLMPQSRVSTSAVGSSCQNISRRLKSTE